MATNDYSESVGEYTTHKTAVGGAQPSSIKTDNAGDSEDLASNIAKRKTGDPNAYERAPNSDDRACEDDDSGKARGGSYAGGDKDKKLGLLSRFKVPLIVSGIVLTVVGALLAVAKQGKEAEERDL
ncbi:hypothetical protein GOP47_0003139 [Adiantum capillus-veneris]|uniref:Uncharacterized protein n=1 Tax=Adiantum capillus-veneris TaxID=13818 RepID=A0A9D4ZRJ8_ADICA|nr:hypothetical protein GOP47_0003139 [Adiantum capillus-veneris]